MSDPIFFAFPADSINPQLLYYSHVPAVIISILLGLFILIKSKKSLASKNLFVFFITFSLWASANLSIWSYQYSNGIVIWALFEPLMLLLSTFAVYFFYSFLHDKFPSWFVVIPLSIIFIVASLLSISEYAIEAFEVYSANIIENEFFLIYCYGGSLIIPLMIPYYYIRDVHKFSNKIKKQAFLLAFGLCFFLYSFIGISALATFLAQVGADELYTLELYGLLAMPFFLAILFYCIVHHGTFNIKQHETAFLIIALILLVGAQIIFLRNKEDQFFTTITFIIVSSLGYLLVRLIKQEEAKKRKSLERINKDLKGLDKAKTEFINLASHQLKTPLTIIKGVASLMVNGQIEKFSEKDKQQFYESVWNKCLKLENIINGILNAAAFSNKDMEGLNQQAIDIKLDDLIRKIVHDFDRQFKEKEITLNFACGNHLIIKGQQQYLEEAFGNIISNAIKYTPSIKGDNDSREVRKEKGVIQISMNQINKDHVIVLVKDNGIGIPSTEISNLFTQFYRANNAQRMYTDGTGLGLYIVKEIIMAHGGEVWVESEIGVGSCFYIKLPISPNASPDTRKFILDQCSTTCGQKGK